MLSRVAERMYWFGRYAERAENTARLINVNTNLVLDLNGVDYIWQGLLEITGCNEDFHKKYSKADERNVIKFLLDSETCSVRNSVRLARENVRTSREIMPNEAWLKINKLNLYLGNNLDAGVKRAGRQAFLQAVIDQCHELTGYLAGSMSNDVPYYFIKMGRNLERADMTTRIIDVGCLNLLASDHPEITEHADILWMNVLKSLTGYQMYRQYVRDRVNGEDVVDFLTSNSNFPRSVEHCLSELVRCFERLPAPDQPLRQVNHTRRQITTRDIPSLLKEEGLHDFIDEIQLDLATLHDQIRLAWFGHEATAEPATPQASA